MTRNHGLFYALSGSPLWTNGTKAFEILRDDYFEQPAPVGDTGLAKVWDGLAFVAKPAKIWTGSAWVQKPVKHWNGTAWVATN